jgi:crotonobetaine/carnitine-CoA ligase
MYVAAVKRGSVVFRKAWSTNEFWNDIRRYRCNFGGFPGGIGEFIAKLPPRTDDRDHTLRQIVMTPIPANLQAFEERFGFKVWSFYSTTEVGTVTYTGLSPRIPGTCGRAREDCELRLLDADGREVPIGKAGELWVRPQDRRTMLQGYLNMPEATAAAWRDGWFRTGDMMRRDAEGNYFFVDRVNDSIRRRGENISSREVEIVVNTHPAVLDSAAIGIPADHAEEEVMVYAELRPGEQLTGDALREYLETRMPKFMMPAVVKIVTCLPRTATGKVLKADLRREARSAMPPKAR